MVCLHIWRGFFLLPSEEFRFCVLARARVLPLCLCFIVFARACTAQWYGKVLVDDYNKVTPCWRPGRVATVTGAYSRCHCSARRSMPGAKLEPTRSRKPHVLFHSWMEQEHILVKVSCSISDALWVNELLSLSANFNSVSIVGRGLLHRLLMMYHIFSLKSIHKRLCITCP
jgi:hypothetical protein